MKKVIIIAGPTAVGKTDIAIKLAKKLNTEIISADSMQIYREMDIGTAKISKVEMDGIKHHMIDIVDPDESFSVQDFQNKAYEIMDELFNKNLIPIIVGGTGLYIDSLIYDYDFMNVKPDYKLRENLEIQYNESPESLLNRVKDISEEYNHINIKDKKKIIRILEVYEKTGEIIKYDRKLSDSDINYTLYVLNDDRKKLYNRINSRVDIMLENGLVNEVKNLIDNGINPDSQSMKAIGYREVIDYLSGNIDYETMVYKLKQNSRKYAKRQLTWFRRNEKSIWIDINKNLKKIFE